MPLEKHISPCMHTQWKKWSKKPLIPFLIHIRDMDNCSLGECCKNILEGTKGCREGQDGDHASALLPLLPSAALHSDVVILREHFP